MGDSLAADHSWLLDAPHATLRSRALRGELDVSRPELGVSRLTINQQACAGSLFGVVRCAADRIGQSAVDDVELGQLPSQELADMYVRGNDLVAAYQPTEAWPYATQLYWQVSDASCAPALLSSVSLLVSLQTHLLDTWPRMCIDTHLEAVEIAHVDCASPLANAIGMLPLGTNTIRSDTEACCILYRLAGMPISYAEMMPGSDMRSVTISRANDGTCHSRWELFAEFLEKGVIRRGRMHSIFVPRDDDIGLARAACNELQRRPLPLTT
jgi:hypothetical protein